MHRAPLAAEVPPLPFSKTSRGVPRRRGKQFLLGSRYDGLLASLARCRLQRELQVPAEGSMAKSLIRCAASSERYQDLSGESSVAARISCRTAGKRAVRIGEVRILRIYLRKTRCAARGISRHSDSKRRGADCFLRRTSIRRDT